MEVSEQRVVRVPSPPLTPFLDYDDDVHPFLSLSHCQELMMRNMFMFPMTRERHTVKRTLLNEDSLNDLTPSQRREVEREMIEHEGRHQPPPSIFFDYDDDDDVHRFLSLSHCQELMMRNMFMSPRRRRSQSRRSLSDTRELTVHVQYEHTILMRRTREWPSLRVVRVPSPPLTPFLDYDDDVHPFLSLSLSDTRELTVHVQYEHTILMRRIRECPSLLGGIGNTRRRIILGEESLKDLPPHQRRELERALRSLETRLSNGLLECISPSSSPPGHVLELVPEASMSFEHHGSPVKLSSSLEFLPPNMSELRVVLLGNSCSERSSVVDFITSASDKQWTFQCKGYQHINMNMNVKCVINVINPPDLLLSNISEDELREHVETCVRLSAPGPHVLLLVLQPEDFTEEHRQRLCRVLELFSDRSFHHSLVLISTPREEHPGFMETYRQHPQIKNMIKMCKYRFLWRKDLEHGELLTRFRQIAKVNKREHLKRS